MRALRWLQGHRPQSVRLRITLVAVAVTTAAVSAGGWALVRTVEGSELGEIRQDNQFVFDLVAARLQDGIDPGCLARAVDPADVAGATVSVEDDDGNINSFSIGYVEGGQTDVVVGSGGSEPAAGGRPEPEMTPECCQGGEQATDCGVPPGSDLACHPGQPTTAGEPDAAGPATTTESPPPTMACTERSVDAGTGGGGEPATRPDETGGTTSGGGGATASGDGEGSGPADDLPTPEDQLTPAATSALEIVSERVSTPDGDVTLTVATPVDQVTEAINAVRTALLVGLPLGVALVALASWWLVGRALRPVEAIRSEADAIGGSTLDRRVPAPDNRDEIGRLALTMNAMLERLEASARRQRQFVADASHELRSPLSAIRTDLEVALLEGDDGDWRESVRASLREEARLEALIADLLVLAAEDEQVGAPPTTPVDLAALAQEEATRPRRLTPSVLCTGSPSTGGDPVHGTTVAGSGRQLRQVVGNLMDNAARHAGSQVRVEVAPNGRNVTVTVDDDGPGIPLADRERVFERFTRLDDGRARDQGGAGLGLAVVRSIVTRHGGTVHATTSPLGGARLVVTLPSSAP